MKQQTIGLVIFDLDGVLLDAKQIHYEALNEALPDEYKIEWNEHLNKYDGLKTNQKLQMLTKDKSLPVDLHQIIWKKKQKTTLRKLSEIAVNKELKHMMKTLNSDGYHLAVCSNSIRKTVYTVVSKLEIIEYLDLVLSNEDVNVSKPHPEMYWSAMSKLGYVPEETLIVEDSPHGLLAAKRSGANIYRVKNSHDLTTTNIYNKINKLKQEVSMKWQDKKLNVLIPMAGAGSRFEKAGYTFPKPLIEVNGKPMIQVVVDNLSLDSNYTFIVQKEHQAKYNLNTVLSMIVGDNSVNIIPIDGITEGAACTTLLAKNIIDNDNPLIIANSDQFVDWNSSEFMYKMQEMDVDAGILTFESTHPKWSFAKTNGDGFVTEVAEKNPISNIATVGIYYWKKGSDYVKYAEQMIQNNTRYNNEFYVCPVFNEAIKDNKKIITYNIENMWGLGTPEDLEYYIKNYIS